MNENLLRWKARMGSLKKIAAILIIGLVVFGLPVITDLQTALQNSSAPLTTGIEQLVDGTISADQFVQLSGYAMYDLGYEEKSGYSSVLATYYFLFDGDAITTTLVKSSIADIETDGVPYEAVTLTGMTRTTPPDLQEALQTDMADPAFEGIRANPGIYLAEGEAPPHILPVLGQLSVISILFLLSVATFFFPRTVFAVKPVEIPAKSKKALPIIRATGHFVQIIQFEPTLKIGNYTKKFDGAVANIIPLEHHKLLIYIRYAVKTTLHGIITISQKETHWGVFINTENLIDIEPGKQYGWRDYWAVRFHYRAIDNKENFLIVNFNSAELQAEFVKSLRERGFSVGSGVNEAVVTM